MITARQRQILEFIARFTASNGFAPSYEEIRAAHGLSSKGQVNALIERICFRGLLKKIPGHSRTLEITAEGHRFLHNVPAGLPNELAAMLLEHPGPWAVEVNGTSFRFLDKNGSVVKLAGHTAAIAEAVNLAARTS